MIFFLFGEDNYQIKKEADKIKKRFIEENKGNAEISFFDTDANEESFEKIKNALSSASFLFGKRLVVLQNLITKGSIFLQEEFKNYLKSKKAFSNDVLFIEKGKINKSDNIFKKLSKKNDFYKECNFLEGRKLTDWILERIQEKKGKISFSNASYLAGAVGNNLFELEAEINKLVAFCGTKEIKREDIDLLVESKVEPEIFKTIDAIAFKDKKKALFCIHEHLKNGDRDFYLRGMISYQFRNILKVRALLDKGFQKEEIQRKTGLYYFVLEKTLNQSKKFDIEKLRSVYNKLLKIDFAIKRSKIEPLVALDLLVIELCE